MTDYKLTGSLKLELTINTADAQCELRKIMKAYDEGRVDLSDTDLVSVVRDLLQIEVCIEKIPSTVGVDFIGLVNRVTFDDDGES